MQNLILFNLILVIGVMTQILFVGCSTSKESYNYSSATDSLGYAGYWVTERGNDPKTLLFLENDDGDWSGYMNLLDKYLEIKNILIDGYKIQFTIKHFIGSMTGQDVSIIIDDRQFEGILAKNKSFILGKFKADDMEIYLYKVKTQ